MVAPDALTKLMLPVHEAAVPPEVAVARFTTLTCAVSEAASPIGGRLVERVVVALVWPMAAAAATSGRTSRLRCMVIPPGLLTGGATAELPSRGSSYKIDNRGGRGARR